MRLFASVIYHHELILFPPQPGYDTVVGPYRSANIDVDLLIKHNNYTNEHDTTSSANILNVLVSLAQPVWTMHKICKLRG
jgi:hypothetical protein